MNKAFIDTIESISDDQVWWIYSLMAYEVEIRIRQHQLDALRIGGYTPIRSDLKYLQQEFDGARSKREAFLRASKVWGDQ